MQNKRWIRIPLFLTLFLSLFLTSLIPIFTVQASIYWLDGFNYRKGHKILYQNGAGANYTIKLIVHQGVGTDTGNQVYCENYCLDNFYDIRFTDDDGVTLLSYWRDPGLFYEGDNATFWVKINDSLDSEDVTIYVYFDCSFAGDDSNSQDTFIFFDDASTDQTSLWQQRDSYLSGTSGSLTWEPTDYGRYKITWTSHDMIAYTVIGISGGNFEVQANFKQGGTGDQNRQMGFVARYNVTGAYLLRQEMYPTPDQVNIVKEPTPPNTGMSVLNSTGLQNIDTNYHTMIGWASGSTLYIWTDVNPSGGGSGGTNVIAPDSLVNSGEWGVFAGFTNTNHIYFSNFRIRKYIDPEPAHSTWGILDTNPEPIVPIVIGTLALTVLLLVYIKRD